MTGGNVKVLFATSGVALCFVALFIISSPNAAASYLQASAGTPEFSFSDLLGQWGRALTDPVIYTSWMHIDGFLTFLANETFLSVFSDGSYGSLSRDTVLGTIPNVFFVICIIVALLSIVTAIVGLSRAKRSVRTIKKT